MACYLVEAFVPRGNARERRARERAARLAAEALTLAGTPVHFHGSIYVPEDEICFYSFEAPSAGDIGRIVERAGLRLLRVVEAIPSNGRDRLKSIGRSSSPP